MKPKTSEAYADEAVRYFANARQLLRGVRVHDGIYEDDKPVREACGTAYLAVLAAVRAYLLARGVSASKLPQSNEAYGAALARHTTRNGKTKREFTQAYFNLHVDGYYRGFHNVDFGKLAFGRARTLIERLTGRRAG